MQSALEFRNVDILFSGRPGRRERLLREGGSAAAWSAAEQDVHVAELEG